MIILRPSESRGHADHGWLDARHSFSFADYHEPEWMGFRTLRVMNEDHIGPRTGFPQHPHRDMEIITYPISGTLRHGDNLGNREDITRGQVQRMTAGSGIVHSEANPSKTDPVHLIQIWIQPRMPGLEPSHETRAVPVHDQPGRLHLLASPDGAGGSMTIQQDARLLAGVLPAGASFSEPLTHGGHGWVQVIRGRVSVNGTTLGAGDGAALTDETAIELTADEDAEVLVFDLN